MTQDEFAAEVAAALPVALARWFTNEQRVALVDVPVIAVDEIPDLYWVDKPRRIYGQYRDETRTSEQERTKSRRVLISRAVFEDFPDPAARRQRIEETLYHELAHALGWNHGGVLAGNWGDGTSSSGVGPMDWTVDVTEGSPA